jgi:hypothetical protein
MLFHAGEKKSAPRPHSAPTDESTGLARPLLCAGCLAPVASEEARIEVAGAHAHRFTNPAGFTYDVVCLREAPGCAVEGTPTTEACWFTGYAWSFANCAACKLHLGWCYDGVNGAPRFLALIENRLVKGY